MELRTVGRTLALGAALCAVPVTAQAQAARPTRLDDDPTTARMLALGGRAEAASMSTSALFANPAMMASARAYHTDGYVLYDPTVSRFSAGSAIADSSRGFSGGLSYVYSSVDTPNDQRVTHDTRLAIAFPLGTIAGLGGTVRYLNASGGPSVPEGSALNNRAWGGFTFDAGLFIRPFQFITLSATGRNLNNPDTSAAPLSLGTGLALTPFPALSIVGDALLDFRTHGTTRGRYSAGVELFIANRYPLRVGYIYDDTRNGAQAITGGIGYVDENIGVEFSMRQGFLPEAQTTLMLSLRYFYRGALQ